MTIEEKSHSRAGQDELKMCPFLLLASCFWPVCISELFTFSPKAQLHLHYKTLQVCPRFSCTNQQQHLQTTPSTRNVSLPPYQVQEKGQTDPQNQLLRLLCLFFFLGEFSSSQPCQPSNPRLRSLRKETRYRVSAHERANVPRCSHGH